MLVWFRWHSIRFQLWFSVESKFNSINSSDGKIKINSKIVFLKFNLLRGKSELSLYRIINVVLVEVDAWHVGKQQRYATLVCSGQAYERSPIYDGGSWAPPLQFDARCSWVTLAFTSPLLFSSLITSPIQLHCLHMVMVSMLSWLQRAKRCWMEIVLARTRVRLFLVWKVSLLRSFSDNLRHCEPYSRVEGTQLWYSLSLVLVLYGDDFLHVVQHSESIPALIEAIFGCELNLLTVLSR